MTSLTTDDLKTAAVVAFRTNSNVRVCDESRCVDVTPDVVVTEYLANGETFRPTWLTVRSSRTFPGRVAYVYDAGVGEVAA